MTYSIVKQKDVGYGEILDKNADHASEHVLYGDTLHGKTRSRRISGVQKNPQEKLLGIYRVTIDLRQRCILTDSYISWRL